MLFKEKILFMKSLSNDSDMQPISLKYMYFIMIVL